MDAEAFQAEALRYERLMYHVSLSMLGNNDDCADAVQEALARAWRKRGSLRDSAAFKGWLMRILVNTCNDALRRRKRQRFLPLEEAGLAAPPCQEPSGLQEALWQLKPEWRLVLVLHYLEGYSVQEIAAALRLPAGTVKSRMLYARRQLSVLLKDEWEEPI